MREYNEEYCTQIVDMFDDSAIVRFYSYIDGTISLMRVAYSCDEAGTVTLGNVNEVHISYEDVIKPSTTATEETGVEQATLVTPSAESEDFKKDIDDDKDDIDDIDDDEDDDCMVCNPEDKKDKDMICDPDKKKDKDMVCDPDKKKDEKTNCSEVVDAACDSEAANAAQVSNAEVTDENTKVSVEDEKSKEEKNSGSTSFTESERAELEILKREKKLSLLDSYKDNLSEEELGNFSVNIDNFTYDALELELLKIYKKHSEEQPKRQERAFAFAPILNVNAKQDSLDAFVRKYKR